MCLMSVLPLHRSQSTWRTVRVQTVWPPWRISRSSTALWPSSCAITSLARTPSSSPGRPSRASASSPNSASKVVGAAVVWACVGRVALTRHLFRFPSSCSSSLLDCHLLSSFSALMQRLESPSHYAFLNFLFFLNHSVVIALQAKRKTEANSLFHFTFKRNITITTMQNIK